VARAAVLALLLFLAQPLARPVPWSYPDRLVVGNLSWSAQIDERIDGQRARIDAACTFHEADCVRANFIPWRAQVAVVYDAPDDRSRIVGRIDVVDRLGPLVEGTWQHLAIGFDFVSADTAQARTWIEDVGDYGYGIPVAGVHSSGEWVQLIGSPFPPNAWIRAESAALTVAVETIENRLVTLAPAPNRRLAAGHYLIESIRTDRVTLRVETPADMPCGDEGGGAPAPTLRSFTVPAADLFKDDGTPRFSWAYPRGC
jgi:hypothetical protein